MNKNDQIKAVRKLVDGYESFFIEVYPSKSILVMEGKDYVIVKGVYLTFDAISKMVHSESPQTATLYNPLPEEQPTLFRACSVRSAAGIYKNIIYQIIHKYQVPGSNAKHLLCQGFDLQRPKQVALDKNTTKLLTSLTKREKDILMHVGEGKSTSQVASDLNIAPSTVENHKANIFKKLQVNKVNDLIRIAMTMR